MADCSEAFRIRPGAANTLNSRALLFKLGSFAKSIQDYSAAIAQDPKDAWSLFGRGVARVKSGDMADGQSDIAAAIAIESDVEKISTKFGLKRG
jgi:hypothetical protein